MSEIVDVLINVAQHKALTLRQLTVLLKKDEVDLYRTVQKMKKQGLIVARRRPGNKKERYVVLSKKGEEAAQDFIQVRRVAYYRTEKIEQKLLQNDVYVEMLKHGLPKEVIIDRNEALQRLGLRAEKALIRWLLDFGAVRYALYMRLPKVKAQIERTINAISADKVTGHILLYPDPLLLQRDRPKYVFGNPPAQNMILASLDGLKPLTEWLQSPHDWVYYLKNALEALSPGGRIIKAPSLGTTCWVWEKKERVLLVNLLLNNIGIASLMRRTGPNEMQKEGWGRYAMFLVPGLREAEMWARLMGWRQWHWFVLADRDITQALYRVSEKALQHVRPKFHSASNVSG